MLGEQASRRIMLKSVRYDVSIDARGAVGVTRWPSVGRPTYPPIAAVTAAGDVVLGDGTTLGLPHTAWLQSAVRRWNRVYKHVSAISEAVDGASIGIGAGTD